MFLSSFALGYLWETALRAQGSITTKSVSSLMSYTKANGNWETNESVLGLASSGNSICEEHDGGCTARAGISLFPRAKPMDFFNSIQIFHN